MILFPDFPEVLIEQVNVADEITLTLRTTSLTASCLRVEPLSGYKAGTHGRCMIFHPAGVLSTSSCMCAAFSAQRGPVRKRFSQNSSRSCAVLMSNAPRGCKKPSASLDWLSGGRQEHG